MTRYRLNALKDQLKNWLSYLFVIMLVVWSIWIVTFIPAIALLTADCAKFGYPQAVVSATWETYCYKSVEGTDHVMPLNTLKSFMQEYLP